MYFIFISVFFATSLSSSLPPLLSLCLFLFVCYCISSCLPGNYAINRSMHCQKVGLGVRKHLQLSTINPLPPLPLPCLAVLTVVVTAFGEYCYCSESISFMLYECVQHVPTIENWSFTECILCVSWH